LWYPLDFLLRFPFLRLEKLQHLCRDSCSFLLEPPTISSSFFVSFLCLPLTSHHLIPLNQGGGQMVCDPPPSVPSSRPSASSVNPSQWKPTSPTLDFDAPPKSHENDTPCRSSEIFGRKSPFSARFFFLNCTVTSAARLRGLSFPQSRPGALICIRPSFSLY